MQKRTKGILAFLFLGGIMVTSGITIAAPGIVPDGANMEFTETGTPADNFPDEQREQFCGDGTSKSNAYITEYPIPTECTQPLAITSDRNGNVWFMQTNTGNITKFDPVLETFVEYDNPSWPLGARSMVWGMDYSADNSVWYSDEAHDSVWRFSIDDEEYLRFGFPSMGDALPQRLEVDGSHVVINDFTGNKLVIMSASAHTADTPYLSIPSPVGQSVTGGFAKDAASNIWYTNWIPDSSGVLIKFDHPRYAADLADVPPGGDLVLSEYLDVTKLPPDSAAINGAVVDAVGTIWLADTASSNFYRFFPFLGSFVRYNTSPVPESAYGNQSGLVLSTPMSRPYWMGLDDGGRVIFNEQTANRMALFDPVTERLIEYTIPSVNPNWADCGDVQDCGVAQAFDFTVIQDKIWFTEWATNNIGVLDTSVPLPVDVGVPDDNLYHGQDPAEARQVGPLFPSDRDRAGPEKPLSVVMEVTAGSDSEIEIVSAAPGDGMVSLTPSVSDLILRGGESEEVLFNISVSDELPDGEYKILLGAQTPDVTVSEFFTLIVN